MEAILIFRQPGEPEIKSICEKQQDPDCTLISAPGIKTKGIITIPPPPEISVSSDKLLLGSMLAFGDKPVGEKTIGELLNLGNFPIWHYQRFRIYFILRPLMLLRSTIKHYLEGGFKVTVYCDADYSKSLKPDFDQVEFILGEPRKGKKPAFQSLVNYLIYFKIKIFLDLIFPPDFSGKKHVIVDRSVRQLCRHPETLKLRFDNYTLSNLLEQCSNDFMIINETEPPKLRGGADFRLKLSLFSGLSRRSKSISGEYILLRGILSRKLHREKERMKNELNEKISFISKMDLNSTDKFIFNEFIRLAPTNSFFIIRYLAFRQFFNKHSFITASAIDENSPATRCILDAARATGAKTIGIQHGNIGNAQPAYLYTEKDRLNRVMADYTLVWGSFWRDFLVQTGNFPSQSVIVTGQVRTDIIPVLNANPGLLKDEIAAGKPVAVFASQPIPDKVLRHKAAYDVFSAFSALPEYELIVKLHPGEKDDIDYYREIALEAGCSDYRLLYDVDLYSLLAVADLVITCYSTVGSEAVYFGKPLIIHDPLKTDLLGYHAAGVALMALNADDIVRIAREILNHKSEPDKEASQHFIDKYAFRIDGNACERTLSFINAVKSDASH